MPSSTRQMSMERISTGSPLAGIPSSARRRVRVRGSRHVGPGQVVSLPRQLMVAGVGRRGRASRSTSTRRTCSVCAAAAGGRVPGAAVSLAADLDAGDATAREVGRGGPGRQHGHRVRCDHGLDHELGDEGQQREPARLRAVRNRQRDRRYCVRGRSCRTSRGGRRAKSSASTYGLRAHGWSRGDDRQQLVVEQLVEADAVHRAVQLVDDCTSISPSTSASMCASVRDRRDGDPRPTAAAGAELAQDAGSHW